MYIPQVGDDVIYLQEGHAASLDATHDKFSPRPWVELTQEAGAAGGALRAAEPCRVVAVQYLVVGESDGLMDSFFSPCRPVFKIRSMALL